jgi:hypothetical protein
MSEAIDRDVKQIEQLLYLYACMVGKREWGLIDQVFSADATIDYTPAPAAGECRTAKHKVAGWRTQAMAHQSASHHEHHAAAGRGSGPLPLLLLPPMGRPGPVVVTSHRTSSQTQGSTDELVRTGAAGGSQRVCEMTVMIELLPADYSIPAA